MPVSIRIGELAKAQGLTIKALAERAGVAYNTAHSLYTGRATRIDLDTLDRMCAALQVQPGDLFIRSTTAEAVEREQEHGGSYGTDRDRPTGTSDRRAPGPL